jgi:1-deoxy-D-xylulose-5-phosphate synthase
VLSYAHGLATAQAATGGGRRVVAVIGDGAMTGGMAFEGLNNLGHSGLGVTIVLNDNGRSYAPTVGRLSESLIRIRSNPTYMRRQRRLEELAEHLPWVGELVERGINATKAAIREMLEPTAFFETLGVHYLGPFDGHDVAEVEEALENGKAFEGPVVVHVLTQKGRGYEPAERDPIKHMHDTSGIKPGSYTEAFTEALVKAAESRPELVAITAAMPDSTGLLPFRERFPDRCFDVGIAEQDDHQWIDPRQQCHDDIERERCQELPRHDMSGGDRRRQEEFQRPRFLVVREAPHGNHRHHKKRDDTYVGE